MNKMDIIPWIGWKGTSFWSSRAGEQLAAAGHARSWVARGSSGGVNEATVYLLDLEGGGVSARLGGGRVVGGCGGGVSEAAGRSERGGGLTAWCGGGGASILDAVAAAPLCSMR
jgi:hypothetical protein